MSAANTARTSQEAPGLSSGDASTNSPTNAAVGERAAQLEASLSTAELCAKLLSFGCRTKAGLAERLGRACRAASEALYAHGELRHGAGWNGGGRRAAVRLPPVRGCHPPTAPHLLLRRVRALPLPLAMAPLTMTPLACAVRSGCSPTRRRCVHFHLLRTSGAHIRKALALRDDKRFAP